jgi:putative DNA primase/helicase
MTNPLEAVVSLWPSAFARADQAPRSDLSLSEIARGIREGARREEIERLRALFASDTDAYQKAKRDLPAFTASGKFSGRSSKALLEHSGCILLDYDHVEDLAGLRARAVSDPHVLLCFLSPSGDGLKIGVRVPPCADAAAHKHAWETVAAYAAVWGGEAKTDEVCKDVARLCFVSYDPDAYTNENAEALVIPEPLPATPAKKREADTEIDDAVARFNDDHARDWGTPGQGECPVCQKPGRFGNAGGAMTGTYRWACWGQTHFQHKVGINAGSYHHGDALDIEAFQAGRERIEHLRECGYLAPRKAKSVVVADEDYDDVTSDRGNTIMGSDLWFARRIAAEHGKSLKYVWEWKAWVAWEPDQGRWVRNNGAAAWSAAKTSAQRILAEAGAVAGNEDRAKALHKAAGRFMSKKGLDAGLSLARSEAAVIASPRDFDKRPYLLNCPNGTVDLQTGKLRPHSRDDMLTKVAGTNYDPDMPTPLWDSFLARILPDNDVRAYARDALGYSAIGNALEHLLIIAWGIGANGKSVLIGTCGSVLGDYAFNAPPAVLMQTNRAEHPTLLTGFKGARLAVVSETPQHGRLDEAMVKALTGGDDISARGMGENYYQFPPTHTLWLLTNHVPRVKETSRAIWRRIRLVPFTVSIPLAEQDRQLPEKLKAEWPGILAWMVRGAVTYCAEGLSTPSAVVAATGEYQADQDDLREFVEMWEPGGWTSTKDVHTEYVMWATELGMKPMGQRTLTHALKGERGWTYVKKPGRGFIIRKRSGGDSGDSEREFQLGALALSFKESSGIYPLESPPPHKVLDGKGLGDRESPPIAPPNQESDDSGFHEAAGDLVDKWLGDDSVTE